MLMLGFGGFGFAPFSAGMKVGQIVEVEGKAAGSANLNP
jgi:hypothetical protein